MSFFLPMWGVIAIVGGILWYMNNRWIAISLWLLAAIWAGFLNIPFLTPFVNEIKLWVV